MSQPIEETHEIPDENHVDYWPDHALCANPTKEMYLPKKGDRKVFFFFFVEKEFTEAIWEVVRNSTVEGGLCYYCGRSPDTEVIAVHSIKPGDFSGEERVKSKLREITAKIIGQPKRVYCDDIEQKKDVTYYSFIIDSPSKQSY